MIEIESHIKELLLKEIAEQETVFEAEGWKLKDFDFMQKDNFIFITAHIDIDSKREIHRYLNIVLSGFTEIYNSSNVIDAKHSIGVYEVQQKAANYFNHIAEKINKTLTDS